VALQGTTELNLRALLACTRVASWERARARTDVLGATAELDRHLHGDLAMLAATRVRVRARSGSGGFGNA
jgi:hypothetical protein